MCIEHFPSMVGIRCDVCRRRDLYGTGAEMRSASARDVRRAAKRNGWARVTELEAALEQERAALKEIAYYLGADCEAPPPDGGPNYNTFADGWVLWARARVRREQRGVRRRAKAKRARARAREEAGGA